MGLLSRIFKPRETAAQRQDWISTAVRSIGNQAHSQLIAASRTASRSFETAETPAWTESWATNGANINQELAHQLPILIGRSRGLARNNEWAKKYLIDLDDNVLGPAGIRLQMTLTMPPPKPPRGTAPDPAAPAVVRDIELNATIERAWSNLCRNIDVAGHSMAEIESLALYSLAADGAILYRLRPGSGPYGFQIQLLDATLLDINMHAEYQGRRIRMGVEITDDGLPVAYWLLMNKTGDGPADYISVGRHVRVPADEIRHKFLIEEVGQLRGIPWLSVGARRLWLTKEFEEAAAVASNNAAKRQGFFTSTNGDAPPGFADTIVSGVLDAAKAAGKTLSVEEIQQITAAAEKYSSVVPGQFDTLPHGYDFKPFESKWPEVDGSSFVKSQLRGYAAARGVSYVTMGNDLSDVNYSSAQVGIVSEREHWKKTQGRLIAWLHAEVFAAALPYLVLHTPSLKASRLADYLEAASWQPRRWAAIDPLKAASSNDTKLRNKTTSRRRIWLEDGLDPDEMRAEIEEDIRLYGALDNANLGAMGTTLAADAAATAGAAKDPKP